MIHDLHERETALLRWAFTLIFGEPQKDPRRHEHRWSCPACGAPGADVWPAKPGTDARWSCRLCKCGGDRGNDLQDLLRRVGHPEPDGSRGQGAGLLNRWREAFANAGYPGASVT